MKKLFFIFSAFVLFSVFVPEFAKASYNHSTTDAAVTFMSTDDQYLGKVNLCDPNGKTCYTWPAYKDAENGRIYVFDNRCDRYYAQKSNDSRWDYMIRYKDAWLYFSF